MVRLLLAAVMGAFVAQQSDPVVHMAQEPRHKVVFEAGTTRVQDIQIPPGDTTLFHTHDHAVLYVPISSSRTRSQTPGQEWSGGGGAGAGAGAGPAAAGRGSAPPQAQQPGRVSSPASYVEKPMTHRVNNIGDNLFRLIAVGNLSNGNNSDTDDVTGYSLKPELLNRYYRAFRIPLAAGQATSEHKHAWPVVVVQQTEGAVATEGTDKVTRHPGQFMVHESGMHQLKNAGYAYVELIEVEVRGAVAK